MIRHKSHWLLALPLAFSAAASLDAQRLEIPRRHDAPPGPPLSPAEAVEKMEVPEGFSVEVVAAEPQIMNPVAMAIDEQGRFWVTESFEYPRKEPGPGRDRIKVLEDTDDDGRVDKVTVFADGLNIPSGIAVGYGGVWVANAPDLLFLQDTDGDLQADVTTRVLTGFGRTDTHELPNAFTWGPDGWLYGLNGVFNYCDVGYTKENPNYRDDHPGWEFTCAMWRLHPRTLEFELFAEGTSNPWGIAINPDGEFFISACVIDHLWHVSESAYYIRQGGPYPAHTWPHRSIVDHKHQKAAYCGIVYFDSDAFPAEYNDCLYMGNIHGGCINTDVLEPRGSSYFGRPRPDFLTANDAWFMPVVQAIGPDGSLYVLDWYDRYHCYQDANADPEGVDRGKGRLYRVRYKDTPRAANFDLAQLSDDQLCEQLGSGNGFIRFTAGRLLAERANDDTALRLLQMADDEELPLKQRLHALWARSAIGPLPIDYLAAAADPECSLPAELRVWCTRLLGESRDNSAASSTAIDKLVRSEQHPRLQLAAIPAIRKLECYTVAEKAERVARLAAASGFEPTIAHVAYETLKELHSQDPRSVLGAYRAAVLTKATGDSSRASLPPNGAEMTTRLVDVAIDVADDHPEAVAAFISAALLATDDDGRQLGIAEKIAPALRRTDDTAPLAAHVQRQLEKREFSGARQTLAVAVLRATLGDSAAHQRLREIASDPSHDRSRRRVAFETLTRSEPQMALAAAAEVLPRPAESEEMRAAVVSALSSVNDEQVADVLLSALPQAGAELRPKIAEALTQRPMWTLPLLEAIEAEAVDTRILNRNQLMRIATFPEPSVQEAIARVLGTIRTEPSNRVEVVRKMDEDLRSRSGDPYQGRLVFGRVCGQCHTIYGEGAEVGPDITLNGRSHWDQLLHNVFDPSAVIGPGYQARILLTVDGRTLTGIPVEENEDRVVLKIQGGKTESVPRDEIEFYKMSPVSMMPEELEKQLTPQEMADLFAFLALDGPPEDADAGLMSGAPPKIVGEATEK